MGDTNNIDLGEGASAKQVAAGQNITQTIIEQQHIYHGARPPDARFSLPAPPRDFTGRASEIETLVGQLTRSERAAITGVAGMGGVGKSALAQVVAQRAAAQFPDGQVWIALRGTDATPTTPADAMRQVILALEPMAEVSKAEGDALAQIYRGVLQGKRVLIVLDNADDNVQIRPLLQADAAFLVTARATLTEGGLRPLRLDVMQEADARTYLLSHGTRLTAGEADALAEVCGYLPLALKISGSYLAARPTIKPASYLAQLRERRLELLRERNDPELNVEAAFSISYNQLTPDLQTLWRLLGVFPAPFWDNAAQYVWGIEDEAQVEAALGELYRESLVEYDETEGKYRLHDLLREFAGRRTTDDERRTTGFRHAEFYEQVAGAADALYLKGGESAIAGLKLFEQELTHLRAGQKWVAEHWGGDEESARLCCDYPGVAAHVMQLRLSGSEQIQWLEDAVMAARKLDNKRAEGGALGNLGLAYAGLGEVRRAIAYYEQQLLIVRKIGEQRSAGHALGNLGTAYHRLGEVQRAIGFYDQQLVVVREIRDRRGEGIALGNLGLAYADLGEVGKAINYYEQRIVIAREIGDWQGEGNALGNLGNVYFGLGEVQTAIAYCEQQLVIMREIGDRRGEGNALGNLGNVYFGLGEVRQAIGYYEQQLVIVREIGDRRGEGNALANMGQAYKKLGDMKGAKELWQQTLRIFVAIEDPNAERVRGWLEEAEGE